ncbi:ubiquinol-cytochrome C reductase [Anaerosporomusa subterranea]|uniref:Ubiquinol-cytochrome C reductase n=1 Tax=Anaerosporomusa subterranea TaxID=1794912 RepID=A0A154BW29_ANASB|nr:EVE domain-containing protein [Anaerosporomusa subterranea]KYZ78233.1 ubiquinol-cytochrome C reductase [Anaerosporomusa subterranea]
MAYWLAKTEPDTFSYADLERLGKDRWNGVRNFVALRHMRQMQPGDMVFIYHTGKEKAIVGIAEVVSLPYPDPESDDSRFIVVEFIPKRWLTRPVTLKEIKTSQAFADWELVTQSRLSVMPVSVDNWQKILVLADN